MKILITGATGLLGINLVYKLKAAGHDLRILVRKQSPTWPFQNLQIEKAWGDVRDLGSLKPAMQGCEVVFHLAGAVNMSPFHRHHTEAINITGTANAIQAAREAGIQRFVHASSIVAIGGGSTAAPADENSAWNYASLKNPYYDSKRRGEELVLAASQHDLDAVVVNPGFIIGPWDIKPSSGELLLTIVRKQLPFYTEGVLSAVGVDDVAQGTIAAWQQGKRGERYILSNENLSYGDFMKLVATCAGVPGPRWAAPKILLKSAGKIGDCLGSYWPGTFSELNSNVLRLGTIDHAVSHAKAKRELGFNPSPVRDAVNAALAWFRQYRYL